MHERSSSARMHDTRSGRRFEQSKRASTEKHQSPNFDKDALRAVNQTEHRLYASASESPLRLLQASAALTEWPPADAVVRAAAARYANFAGRAASVLHVAIFWQQPSWSLLQPAALVCATASPSCARVESAPGRPHLQPDTSLLHQLLPQSMPAVALSVAWRSTAAHVRVQR